MIVIFSSRDSNLDGTVDARFGRCAFLVKMDTDSKSWEAFPNPGVGQSGGAGIAAAQFAIDHKAQAVVSGDFGPNASKALQTAGIGMYLYSDNSVTVSQALEQFSRKSLSEFSSRM